MTDGLRDAGLQWQCREVVKPRARYVIVTEQSSVALGRLAVDLSQCGLCHLLADDPSPARSRGLPRRGGRGGFDAPE